MNSKPESDTAPSVWRTTGGRHDDKITDRDIKNTNIIIINKPTPAKLASPISFPVTHKPKLDPSLDMGEAGPR